MKQPEKVTAKLDYGKIAHENTDDVCNEYQSSEKGLSDDQVTSARNKYGSNEVTQSEKTPFIVEALKAYITPFTLVLLGIGLVSLFTDVIMVAPDKRSYFGCGIVFLMVFISGTMTLIQSEKSNEAASKLKSLVKATTSVIRNGQTKKLGTDQLVCGDIVSLAAGDMIPTDMRLIETKDLTISQSALTGESYPVLKHSSDDTTGKQTATTYKDLVFMGSNVNSGSAKGIVIATGKNTLFGDVAETLAQKPVKTSFDVGINKTSFIFIKFMAVMAPAVFFIEGFTKGDWMQAFLFGLSVAVGLTPEMLPMIVTTNLVRGASKMAQKKTVVKDLGSIQNFGSMDVLCSDKTGTLTQDKIVLEKHLGCDNKDNDDVLRAAYLNSYYQTGYQNLLDKAIVAAANEEVDAKNMKYQKVDEIPFDFQRRRMSVVVKGTDDNVQMITKGAIEEMVNISSYIQLGANTEKLTNDLRDQVINNVTKLNESGLRVIGVARKINPDETGAYSVADETGMTIIGYLAFLDPPKESSKQALQALKQHGVNVKVLTGDNAPVTQSVCNKVGLDGSNIVSGEDMIGLNNQDFSKLVESHSIFAKLNPQQKQRIVETLRKNGHTVGYMGDGINDAPSLKVADVGISVDTAVDIAQESANIILLQKDLMVLEQGIVSGRETFGNIMKYIKATASSNFGNMFSVLIASIFLPFLPMLPLQLLLLNLMYDTSCISIPWDHMDKEYLDRPKKWDASSISKFMFWFGPTSSIFDVTTYLLMFYVICPQVVGGQYESLNVAQTAAFVAIFHAGWFVESMWTQELVLHSLRTPKIPFIQSHASWQMTLVTSIAIFLGSILPFTTLGHKFGLAALPGSYWPWLIATIFGYLILVTIVKHFYIRRYGDLL